MAKRNQEDLGLDVVDEYDAPADDTQTSEVEKETSAAADAWVLGVPDDDKRLEHLPTGSADLVSTKDRITPTSDALRSEFDGDRPRENPRPAPKVEYERSPKTGTLTAVVQPS